MPRPRCNRPLAFAGALLAIAVGCQGPAAPTAPGDAIGADGRYTLRVDPLDRWDVEHDPRGPDQLTLIRRVDRPVEILSFRRIPVASTDPDWTASDAALGFAERERRVMVREGVDRGRYRLDRLERDFAEVEGQTFFRMGYRIHSLDASSRASLLFYFERFERPTDFLAIWAGTAERGEESLADPLDRPALRKVLASLEVPEAHGSVAKSARAQVESLRAARRARLAAIGGFDPAHGVETRGELNALAAELDRQFPYAVLARGTGPGGPPTELRTEWIDRDLDGVADQAVVRSEDGAEKLDRRFVFDLDRDGRFDCAVARAQDVIEIDTNADGREDVRAIGADLDGDAAPDPGVAAWLRDLDFDGRFDEAEYLGPGFRQPIPLHDGVFEVATVRGVERIPTAVSPGSFFVATDLSDLD